MRAEIGPHTTAIGDAGVQNDTSGNARGTPCTHEASCDSRDRQLRLEGVGNETTSNQNNQKNQKIQKSQKKRSDDASDTIEHRTNAATADHRQAHPTECNENNENENDKNRLKTDPESKIPHDYNHETDSTAAETNQTHRITVLDLCAGCGGIAHASRQLNLEHLALIEDNMRCVKTLIENGFHTTTHAELQTIDFSAYKGVSLITGGLPCQPWSIGGMDTGSDDRRNLWDEEE